MKKDFFNIGIGIIIGILVFYVGNSVINTFAKTNIQTINTFDNKNRLGSGRMMRMNNQSIDTITGNNIDNFVK